MPRISPKVITHKLNIDPKYKLIRQKKRNFAPERQMVINEEANKLLASKFIQEAHYLDWLVDIVMVKKANRKWWIYINYTYFNKACLKDSIPLLKTDQLINMMSGHKLPSFIDAFSEYDQIRMVLKDKKNIAFVIEKDIYYYKVNSFGLKNTGMTYQRLVNKVFNDQIR